MASQNLKYAMPWFSVACILILYLSYLAWLRPATDFGRYHDDTLYFGSAQALAQGRGYIIPSLPGTPPQTLYPVLYPWLLSWIWRWSPSFPANVVPAVWMTALFGCWFLVVALQLLRKLQGVGDGPALLLVALCAFQPHFLFLSGAVLSDVPFMALAMTAMLAADSAVRREGRTFAVAATAILAGLSVSVRMLGIAVVAGIFVTALYRRAYRQAAIFSLIATPVVAALLWPSTQASAAMWARGGAANGEVGWRQTLLSYTSYAGFWRLSIPRPGVLLSAARVNLQYYLEAPATYCLFPPLGGERSFAGVVLCIALSVGILAGIARQARRHDWKPIHMVFLFYSAIVLLWDYPLMDRVLILFVPLFYVGLWVEGKHFASLVLKDLRSGRSPAEKALAGALGIAMVAVAATAVRNYLDGYRSQLRTRISERARLAREKLQVYDWLRLSTKPNTRVVAYEDVSLYLYTGRQAVRPMAFSTETFYTGNTRVLQRELTHITDTAQHIRAHFWVTAPDDFEQEADRPLIEARMAQLKSVLPMVFHSRENNVQVYDLSCLLQTERAECQSAIPILFPNLGDHGQEGRDNLNPGNR